MNITKKHKGKIALVGMIVVALTLFVYLQYRHSKVIDLGPLEWEVVRHHISVLKTKNGRILVGPTGILLWGEYPYVYGQRDSGFFVIDLRTNTVRPFKSEKEFGVQPVPLNKYVTFGDLRGQYGNKERLRQLRENLKKRKTD